MKLSTLISIIVATLAIGGIVVAFLGNASPYISVKEAKTMSASGIHVVGKLEKSTLTTDIRAGKTEFILSDENGDRLPVVYNGPPVQNLTAADRVVVVGSSMDGRLQAEKILVKCPSKYEGQD